jgi:putative membrane protein
MNNYDLFGHLKASLIFGGLGLVIFGVMWFLIIKLSPFSIRKEIEEDQNTSLAILIGFVFLSIAIILAAAIHG